jgi:hypothetical protein
LFFDANQRSVILAAIRRTTSRVSDSAADCRPDLPEIILMLLRQA